MVVISMKIPNHKSAIREVWVITLNNVIVLNSATVEYEGLIARPANSDEANWKDGETSGSLEL